MPKVKSYKVVLEGKLTNGKDLKEIYGNLEKMTDVQIAERINTIDEEMEKMAKEAFNRQRRIREGRPQKQRNATPDDVAIEEIHEATKELEDEKKMLQMFPKVKKKLKMIAELQDRMKKQKGKQIKELNGKLQELNDKLKEMEKKQQEIDNKIQEKMEKIEALDEDKKDEMAKLYAEVGELTIKSKKIVKNAKKEKIEKDIVEAKKTLSRYKRGTSPEDKIINKCKLPWKNLLNGMKWQEIARMSNEKLGELAGIPKKDKEAKGEENTKKDEGIKPQKNTKKDEDIEPSDTNPSGQNGGEEKPQTNRGQIGNSVTLTKGIHDTLDMHDDNKPSKKEFFQIVRRLLQSSKASRSLEVEMFRDEHPILGKIPFLSSILINREERADMNIHIRKAFDQYYDRQPTKTEIFCINHPKIAKVLEGIGIVEKAEETELEKVTEVPTFKERRKGFLQDRGIVEGQNANEEGIIHVIDVNRDKQSVEPASKVVGDEQEFDRAG